MNKPEKITTPVRFSHLTSYAGVGGIVQTAEDLSVVMPDIKYWVGSTEIMAVKRVCCSLGISGKERHELILFLSWNKRPSSTASTSVERVSPIMKPQACHNVVGSLNRPKGA